MGYHIGDADVRQGLAEAQWPGRLELIQNRPMVFLDGAHNPAGARALVRFWKEHLAGRRIFLVYGAMRDKAVPEISEILFPEAAAVVLTRPQQARAAQPETIYSLTQHLNNRILIEPSPTMALESALELAKAEDVIFATGSLFLVADLKRDWAAPGRDWPYSTMPAASLG
jgi:dihydrofolate synthase/folylpolyglutamate synthase